MIDPLAQRPDPRELLQLARSDKAAAEARLGQLSRDEQVAIVCDAPLASRARMLELLEHPEDVIPLIPEAELCFTVKAVGLVDGSWILEHATDEQLVAAADLDAWQGLTPDPQSMGSWLENYVEAGGETLLRAARAIDAEVWVLYLRERIGVVMKPNDDEGWQPPDSSATLDGQFHYWALSDRDDLAAIGRLLQTVFEKDYWLYFRILQGVMWEMVSDLEEWASRWRTGRLEDLGFPAWDEAMRIYGFIRPDRRAEVPEEEHALEVEGYDLPVWMPRLPATRDAREAIFRAAAELDEDERRSFFYAFVSLANKLAVADGLSLGDIETLPKALEKAASLTSTALEYIAKERALDPASVLRRVRLEHLFRVGANLDRALADKDRLSYGEQLERALERFEGGERAEEVEGETN